MKIPLSARLRACCDFVAPGDRVADIGCDHGYLGIYLLHTGVATHVIASDINEGPLRCAMGHAEKYGVREKIEFHLSDGVSGLPRNFDTMVCAGMGADTMISILEAAPWLQTPQYRLILQCQSKTHCLREYLTGHGWKINREKALRDGRFLYTVMEVIWQPGLPFTAGQCYFPPVLLESPTEALPEYYQRIIRGLQLAVANKGAQAVPELATALEELEALTTSPELQFLKGEPL